MVPGESARDWLKLKTQGRQEFVIAGYTKGQGRRSGGFGANQYANRAKVAGTIKSWGANLVRFRVLADDYNSAPSAATGNLTKAQIIQRIKDWRDAVVAQGMAKHLGANVNEKSRHNVSLFRSKPVRRC